MFAVTMDLGGAASVLEALRNPANAQRIANVAAETYETDMLDWIEAGKSFTTRTGQLGQSIGWQPLGDGSAEIYANADYALYVEEGTRPHLIPKDGIFPTANGRMALKIPTSGGGGYILRRKVNHPGTEPMPFFFADSAGREERMGERALSVLAGIIEHA